MDDDKPREMVCVFEAVNETLREFYLGTTTLTAVQFVDWFTRHTPPAISHWKQGEKISSRIVESGMGPEEARKFLEHYAMAASRIGWKVYVE